jgi:hypothetical protein
MPAIVVALSLNERGREPREGVLAELTTWRLPTRSQEPRNLGFIGEDFLLGTGRPLRAMPDIDVRDDKSNHN